MLAAKILSFYFKLKFLY